MHFWVALQFVYVVHTGSSAHTHITHGTHPYSHNRTSNKLASFHTKWILCALHNCIVGGLPPPLPLATAGVRFTLHLFGYFVGETNVFYTNKVHVQIILYYTSTASTPMEKGMRSSHWPNTNIEKKRNMENSNSPASICIVPTEKVAKRYPNGDICNFWAYYRCVLG